VVNMDFFDRRSAERFAELLDETSGGRRHHNRGQADEQLAGLVAIGHSLSAARSGVQVDPEFRVGLRAMLVATAERDGVGSLGAATIAVTATTSAEPGTHAGVRETGRGLFRVSGSGRRIRARGAIVIGVAAGAMAVSGISAASENASPGDALYPVKRSTERAQLAMAGSDITRGQLSLDFARTRLTEAVAIPGNDTAFAGVLNDMDADTKQGVRLLTGSAVARKQTTSLGTVDTFVIGQRHTFETLLDKLSPANTERAMTSIALLGDVHRRTENLRAGLACATPVSAGADALGPKLKDCVDGTDHGSSISRPQGVGQRQGGRTGSGKTTGTARPDPAGSPGVTRKATPNKNKAVVPTTSGSAAPGDPSLDDPSLNDPSLDYPGLDDPGLDFPSLDNSGLSSPKNSGLSRALQ
jgi:hypothetical protein